MWVYYTDGKYRVGLVDDKDGSVILMYIGLQCSKDIKG